MCSCPSKLVTWSYCWNAFIWFSIFWLKMVAWRCCTLRALLYTCVRSSLMRPQFPVFLIPRPHVQSRLHGYTPAPQQWLFTDDQTLEQRLRPKEPVSALYFFYCIPNNLYISLLSTDALLAPSTMVSISVWHFVFQLWLFGLIWFVTWCHKPIFLAMLDHNSKITIWIHRNNK